MIKCIAIDMDGTLLNEEHQITKENVQAVKKAQEAGIEVVIATGRSYPEAITLLRDAGIICSVICVNGAEVRSVKGEITDFHPLNKEAAKQTLDLLEKNDMYIEFFTSEGIFTCDIERGYSMFRKALLEAEKENMEEHLQERVNYIHNVDSFDLIFQNKDHHIYKLLAFSLDLDQIKEAGKQLEKIEEIAVSSSGKENLEINGISAQKGIALEAFTKEKGISLMDTMAIGDNYNDLSMFQRVGRAVAMGNADGTVKGQCHLVTLTNNESGVAKAINDVIS